MFQQIRYFQSVIRLNSFSEAAAECHISQSAVSQQVQALERELGITLVAFTPLAKGSLSGRYAERPTFYHPEDNRSGRSQFSEEGFQYYQQALELIRGIAEEKTASMAQIAIPDVLGKFNKALQDAKENG